MDDNWTPVQRIHSGFAAGDPDRFAIQLPIRISAWVEHVSRFTVCTHARGRPTRCTTHGVHCLVCAIPISTRYTYSRWMCMRFEATAEQLKAPALNRLTYSIVCLRTSRLRSRTRGTRPYISGEKRATRRIYTRGLMKQQEGSKRGS